jgi:hypothetical protein
MKAPELVEVLPSLEKKKLVVEMRKKLISELLL